jgi:hypothetical protein
MPNAAEDTNKQTNIHYVNTDISGGKELVAGRWRRGGRCCELDSSDSGEDIVHTVLSLRGPIKGLEFQDYLSDYQLHKDSVPCREPTD